jgi:DedD protein
MDRALKQRLVGAVVLIALAVILLPMMLGGRPESGAPVSPVIELPPQPPGLDFGTRKFPISTAPGRPAEDAAQEAPGPLPEPGRTTVQETAPAQADPAGEAEPLTAPASADPPVAEPEPPPPARRPQNQSDEGGRYVVQVASFGAAQNASRLSDTLNALGYAVMVDSVKSDVGTLHRVRVGPYATESDANAAVSRLGTQVDDLKPRVMDLRPDQTAQVTTPSDPLVRWVVQVGSFSSSANADKLVAQLRLEALSAYQEEVSSGARIIHRVRIGPFLERDEATRVAGELRANMNLDGVVMSAD